MRFLIRILIVFCAVTAAISLIRGIFSKSLPNGSRARRATLGGRLAKDPVCGTYVSERTALRGGDQYFCSEECRSKFIT